MIGVYIAAPWSRRSAAKDLATELRALGYRVTSRWLEPHLDGKTNTDSTSDLEKEARIDLADVASAGVLVQLNYDGWAKESGGGCHAEFGSAATLRKGLVLVGVRTSCFHHLSQVVHVSDTGRIDEAITKAWCLK